jgi:hypothetical protein
VRKADKLTATCELIVYKMWEPRRLTLYGPPRPVTGIALPSPNGRISVNDELQTMYKEWLRQLRQETGSEKQDNPLLRHIGSRQTSKPGPLKYKVVVLSNRAQHAVILKFACLKPDENAHIAGNYFVYLLLHLLHLDCLYGIVVRVSGYRSRGSGFDSRPYQIF